MSPSGSAQRLIISLAFQSGVWKQERFVARIEGLALNPNSYAALIVGFYFAESLCQIVKIPFNLSG